MWGSVGCCFSRALGTPASSLPETVRDSRSHSHLAWHLLCPRTGTCFSPFPWNLYHSWERAAVVWFAAMQHVDPSLNWSHAQWPKRWQGPSLVSFSAKLFTAVSGGGGGRPGFALKTPAEHGNFYGEVWVGSFPFWTAMYRAGICDCLIVSDLVF